MALHIEEAIEVINDRVKEKLLAAGMLVEADAKKNCPVDTGNLRASINTQLAEDENAVYVGTNVEYAAYVEEGTSKMNAQPFLHPALEQNKQTIIDLFKGIV